ncbi:MAG: Re/Si-specific NAD(P)(+) transhydrogenase subunit alpha [Phenylobacterium sp.]
MSVIATYAEHHPDERRVALTPDVVGKFVKAGVEVLVEAGAGVSASVPDEAYAAAGAKIATRAEVLAGADVLACVRAPSAADAAALKAGCRVVGLLDPFNQADALAAMAARGVDAYAMELVPRITRAQVMDALSSQANLAGYRAVIEAAGAFSRILPMMTTAAGTLSPAKVFVMGAGVAGLQAIATARRLGAIVTATDVRPAAKEQVQSLGARFVAVEDEEFRDAETEGGYAKPMSADYQAKQAELVAAHIKGQDIVITTALIPGKPAPRLVTAAHLATMRPGSVVVDMAAEQGGNVEGSSRRETVTTPGGVIVLSGAALTSQGAADASTLYARNIQAFVNLLLSKGDEPDEILSASCVVAAGQVRFAAAAA